MADCIFFNFFDEKLAFFGDEKGKYYEISDNYKNATFDASDLDFFENIDLIYRTLCSILYNFAPQSGHPGGSISSGRIVQSLIFENMLYDFSEPNKEENDLIIYAAGHKALGLYALWALRNELINQGDKDLLPKDEKYQLRLEDLLGFRKNPLNDLPLFKRYNSKPLDGHPVPSIPFVKFATGASGVGFATSVGYAFSLMDTFGEKSPKVNILEGEGGLTSGRVSEAIASASTANLYNIIAHIDWNQASIDSNNVCKDVEKRGDYVQWSPDRIFCINDWNVIKVKDGMDFKQILLAQKFALNLKTEKPTAIVYRTKKGWKYGIEGKASHGKGHKFCSNEYYKSLKEFENKFNKEFPRFKGDKNDISIEENFYETLMVIRETIKENKDLCRKAKEKIINIKEKLKKMGRGQKTNSYKEDLAFKYSEEIPNSLEFLKNEELSLKEALGKILWYINKERKGSIIATSADVFDSTNVNLINKDFGEGFYNAITNRKSKLFAPGGICEDAMVCIASGISSFGKHIAVASSYASFVASLGHLPAKLYIIGQQARKRFYGEDYNTFIIVNSHSSLTTGQDGPTHSDPQALQLLQENFPKGTLINLTPWHPLEIYYLLLYSLSQKPPIVSIFVTREDFKLKLEEGSIFNNLKNTTKGIYKIMEAKKNSKQYNGTIVLQGSGVACEFIKEVLPFIKEKGFNMNVFYVSSKELFELLNDEEKESLFPQKIAEHSIGITDFTLPTMYYWIRSYEGIKRSLHPFKNGYYYASGKAKEVLKEAGLDSDAQRKSIGEYAKWIEKNNIKLN